MEASTINFSAKELRCKCDLCRGEVPHKIEQNTLDKLQRVRSHVGFALPLSSAYRCENHPIEVAKKRPGTHARARAFDIALPFGEKRMAIVEAALIYGFKGFGFATSFIHIDDADTRHGLTSWGYSK